MKMLLVAYNEAIDEEVMELLNAHSVEGYTKWTKVLGKGGTSGPHLASHVWPKTNNVLMIAAENEQAEMVLQGVRSLRGIAGAEGVKAFQIPLEEVT